MSGADAFSPATIHDTITRAIAQQGIVVPDGHTQVFGTTYDGQQVQAFYAQRIHDRWTLGGDVAWHGGVPSFGVEIHYSK